jgi:hypothetical protein
LSYLPQSNKDNHKVALWTKRWGTRTTNYIPDNE